MVLAFPISETFSSSADHTSNTLVHLPVVIDLCKLVAENCGTNSIFCWLDHPNHAIWVLFYHLSPDYYTISSLCFSSKSIFLMTYGTGRGSMKLTVLSQTRLLLMSSLKCFLKTIWIGSKKNKIICNASYPAMTKYKYFTTASSIHGRAFTCTSIDPQNNVKFHERNKKCYTSVALVT